MEKIKLSDSVFFTYLMDNYLNNKSIDIDSPLANLYRNHFENMVNRWLSIIGKKQDIQIVLQKLDNLVERIIQLKFDNANSPLVLLDLLMPINYSGNMMSKVIPNIKFEIMPTLWSNVPVWTLNNPSISTMGEELNIFSSKTLMWNNRSVSVYDVDENVWHFDIFIDFANATLNVYEFSQFGKPMSKIHKYINKFVENPSEKRIDKLVSSVESNHDTLYNMYQSVNNRFWTDDLKSSLQLPQFINCIKWLYSYCDGQPTLVQLLDENHRGLCRYTLDVNKLSEEFDISKLNYLYKTLAIEITFSVPKCLSQSWITEITLVVSMDNQEEKRIPICHTNITKQTISLSEVKGLLFERLMRNIITSDNIVTLSLQEFNPLDYGLKSYRHCDFRINMEVGDIMPKNTAAMDKLASKLKDLVYDLFENKLKENVKLKETLPCKVFLCGDIVMLEFYYNDLFNNAVIIELESHNNNLGDTASSIQETLEIPLLVALNSN